ncbi:hypothetical protein EJB05_53515, partial [Eragrostis curvula]
MSSSSILFSSMSFTHLPVNRGRATTHPFPRVELNRTTTNPAPPHGGSRSRRPPFLLAYSRNVPIGRGRVGAVVDRDDLVGRRGGDLCGGASVILSGDGGVPASGGGGDGVPPSSGGGRGAGGGGGGGGGESGNAGGGDGEHPPFKSLLVRILTKPKLDEPPWCFDWLAEYATMVFRLLASNSEGAVLSVLGIVVEDNLRCPSSFDVPSSRMDAVNSMDVEGRGSSDNYNTERRSAWNRFVQFVNNVTTNWGRMMAPAGTPPDVNRKKGLLGSFYTIAEKLFIFCGGLVIWSLQYPLGSNARRTFDDPGMQGIIIASFVSFFVSCILAPLAAYLKESESIQGAGIKIFKWLFLIVLLGLCAELSVILRFCADIRKPVMWSLGIVGSIAIVLIWAWVFYIEVPQQETSYLTENEMLLEMHAPSEPTSFTPSLPPV